jgi:hypothetical protein
MHLGIVILTMVKPIDMRDDQLFCQVTLRTDNEDDIETLPQSSVERIMQLQMKQMQFMQYNY